MSKPPIKNRRDFLGAGTRLAVAASLTAGTLGAFVREARAATATQINAQAHYTVPAYQATAPEQAQPLTGSASAWVFKFPAMVGEMPRSGGFGHGGYIGAGMFTVLLAAGLAGIVFRRQRTTE